MSIVGYNERFILPEGLLDAEDGKRLRKKFGFDELDKSKQRGILIEIGSKTTGMTTGFVDAFIKPSFASLPDDNSILTYARIKDGKLEEERHGGKYLILLSQNMPTKQLVHICHKIMTPQSQRAMNAAFGYNERKPTL